MTIDFTRVHLFLAASLAVVVLFAIAGAKISLADTANYDGVDPETHPVPKRFRGTYVLKRELDAILSRRKPIQPMGSTMTFTEHEAFYGTRRDMVSAVAKHVGGSRTAQDVEISGPDGKWVISFKVKNRRAYFGEGEDVEIRLKDVAPPLFRFNLQNIPMTALLARGYRTDAGEILWLEDVIAWPPGAGDPSAQATTPTTHLRGIGNWSYLDAWFSDPGDPIVSVGWQEGNKTFLVTQNKGNLVFTEHEEIDQQEYMEYVPVEGGVVIRARLLPKPPFQVLADTLSLRTDPDWKTKRLGALHLGDRVALWARTRDAVTRGGLTGHFGLLQKGRKMGWAFMPYVARLLPEKDGFQRFTTAYHPIGTAPVFETKKQAGAGFQCQLRPTGPDSKPLKVETGLGAATSAQWALANLDGDEILDPACVLQVDERQVVCTFLSKPSKNGGFTPAGCVTLEGTGSVAISSKDTNGDGHRDLRIGVGKNATSFLFDPASGTFRSTGEQ